MSLDSQPPLLTARLIAGSLIAGVALFMIVGWFIIARMGGIAAPGGTFSPSQAMWLWLAVALPTFVVGLVFRRRGVAELTGVRTGAGVEEARRAQGQGQTSLVIAWSLFEGPALLSCVLYLLVADPSIAVAGAAVFGVGMFASFPRAAWYERSERVLAQGSRSGSAVTAGG